MDAIQEIANLVILGKNVLNVRWKNVGAEYGYSMNMHNLVKTINPNYSC